MVEDLRSHEVYSFDADLVVVAADAFRSPQLLWASGIRPRALGHYLTEHPVVISTVALDAESMRRFATEEELDAELARRATNPADPVAAVNRIPFSEPGHPFSLQVMYAERPPFQLDPEHPAAGNRWGYVNMGYGMRKQPRYDDGVTFDDDELDYRGFPNMTVSYELTDGEQREIAEATERLRRAGNALGTFVAEPRLLPNGSSLHYQGTMRMGAEDDGTSVADPYSRVWGYENLVVGGNALIPTATTHEPHAHERRDRRARRAQGRRAAGRGDERIRRRPQLTRTSITKENPMLEEQLIQTAGFRNVGPEGAPTGFQLRVRSPYYRGLWANLIEKPTVTVDGERFDGDDHPLDPPGRRVLVRGAAAGRRRPLAPRPCRRADRPARRRPRPRHPRRHAWCCGCGCRTSRRSSSPRSGPQRGRR